MTAPVVPYPPRYFRLRYEPEFTDDMIAAVREGYREWKEWVEKTLRTWSDVPHRAKLPKPNYTIGEPELSADHKMISVRLEGDPITHGALMTFEDGVPLTLYRHIPRERRDGLKVGYENQDLTALNSPALAWQDALR